MKKFILALSATLATVALIPASFAARRTRPVQQIPARPALERVHRRTLINNTRRGYGKLINRGTRGNYPWTIKSSSSSSVSSSEASSASSTTSSSASSSSTSAE